MFSQTGRTSSGEVRSGSANTASNATTAAPASNRTISMSASLLRGQGHWPIRARLASSMSITLTGTGSYSRGWTCW